MKSRFIRNELKKFSGLILASLLCFSFIAGDYSDKNSAGQALADSDSSSASVSYTDVTGSMNFHDLQVSNFSSGVLSSTEAAGGSYYETRTVIVSFSENSLIDSAGSAGLEAYRNTFTGQVKELAIENTHKQFYNTLSREGIAFEKVYNYKYIDNAVAIKIDTSFVSDIKAMEGVESVIVCDSYAAPQTVEEDSSSAGTVNATNVYATGVYDSSKYVEEYGGKGMTVAILDTGIDYTHDAFRLTDDSEDYYYNYSQEFRKNMKWSESDIAQKMAEGGLNAKGDVYVSDRIPFGFDYADNDADVYPSYSNHGTHVAGIIGGRAASYTDKDGKLVYAEGYDETSKTYTKDGYDYIFADEAYTKLATQEFIGVAPYAQLVICKVFTDNLDSKDIGGATTEDILAALEDCVTLGVDVINMSLGTTNGFSSTNDGDDEGDYMNDVYTSVENAGISLVCAASNEYSSGYGSTFGTNLASNPDSGTVGSPSTYSGAISVASISGKKSPYLIANAGTDSQTSVYFRESSDENNVDYDFIAQMLELGKDSKYYDSSAGVLTVKYIVIPGVGSSTNYTPTIKKAITSAQDEGYLAVALVQRGTNTFQNKVENAMAAGADAVIVYNNVAGEIKMTIGDIDNPIPAISTTQVMGQALADAAGSAKNYTGTLSISLNYSAGPFMSDFSSWGVTSDLKLKPEITAHGGEITSAVPGGYSEMSGTSMATPNVSGLMANILSYIKQNYAKFFDGEYDQEKATTLAYQLMMSTATTVYDADGLPYSPRKQGAGLASLDNIISTKAYLYTVDGDTVKSAHSYYTVDTGNRPKIELGEDEDKIGEYTLVYYLNNISGGDMSFTLKSLFFTESLSLDGLAVAEQAYMLAGNAVWTINGKTYSDGAKVTFGEGTTKISVKISLTDDEKKYLDESFVNGMFVEGFLQLISSSEQCDLSIPFLGFYGDWEAAPMLDYDAYEIAEIEADTSLKDEEKPSATVWATQPYATYWNNTYVIPMGGYLYLQDEDADQVYVSEEHTAISCYNDETADSTSVNSYMTAYAIRGLYAGLLRNAKYVTVTMTNAATGEEIYTKIVYRAGKAVADGGSVTPAFVKLELTPDELGLVENGRYTMEFNFFFHSMDEEITEDNTFTFSFYVDYSAPILENAAVRYVDYKDANDKDKQRVYLDLDIYDNHYAMAALLCYYRDNAEGEKEAVLATEYVTPVLNAVRNGVNTVTIEITDIMELIEKGLTLYLELDDYAMNHSIYALNINTATASVLPSDFSVKGADADGSLSISIGKLETYKVSLEWDTEEYPSANLSNFTWNVLKGGDCIAVKNGEIVGIKAGNATVHVVGKNGKYHDIYVTVTDNDKKLTAWPAISFGTIYNSADVPVVASGYVSVNIEQNIKLNVEYDPWYYEYVADADKKEVTLEWKSTDESVAEVDGSGNVTLKKKGTASISATIVGTAYAATVTFSVQEAFTVSSYSLTGYAGAGGVVYIPTDMNIMTIGNEAFKYNTDITAVVIPKTVTTIGERAFYGCTNLKYVFFDDVTALDIADCDLTLINKEAFKGCTSLEYVDFSNCKTFTVASNAFDGCTSLQIIKGIEKISTAYNRAFAGCTSLKGSLSSDSGVELVNSIIYNDRTDPTELEGLKSLVANTSATDLRTVRIEISETSTQTASACTLNIKTVREMLKNVTSLDITGLHVSGYYVFADCDNLTAVTMGEFTSIGAGMFNGCDSVDNVVIKTASVGDYAFYDCAGLYNITFDGVTNGTIGNYAFASKEVGNLSSVTFNDGVTIKSIGDCAFANNYMSSFTLPEGLSYLGDDLFAGGDLKSLEVTCDLSEVTFNGSTFNSISDLTLKDGLEALVIDGNILYNKDKTKVILALSNATEYNIADTVTEIGNYAFANKKALTSVTIPAGVTTIGDYSFYNTGLTSVTIPAGVTSIGEGAFHKCSKLASVTFAGSSLKTIGDGAFEASAITSITLPSSVTEVGSYAFAETSLTSFDYAPAKTAAFGGYVFAYCTELEKISLADNITTMGDGTFYGCDKLTTVALPSVDELGNFTFFRCVNLESVTYGEDATVTGNYTFYSYDEYYETQPFGSLTSVTLGKKTTAIGDMAFIYCTVLESIDLSNIKTIGSNAFWYNTSLKNVKGLEKVENIGAYAFYGCSSLENIDISGATAIGDFAFYGNAASEITIPATLGSSTVQTVVTVESSKYARPITTSYEYTYSPMGVGVFANASNLVKFTVADGNADYFTDDNGVLYRKLANGGYELMSYPSALNLSNYTVLDGTVRIDAYAFANLTAGTLKQVTFPYELTNVGAGAFYSSGVTKYNFTSYTAPTLEAEISYDTSNESDYYFYYYMTYMSNTAGSIFRGLYNTNFDSAVIDYASDIVYVYYNAYTGDSYQISAVSSTLEMTYPENGSGYTNYIYGIYFGKASTTDVVLSVSSAAVAKNLTSDGWYSVAEINSWATAEVTPELTAEVTAFSELVKATHLNYNNMKNDSTQMDLLKAKLSASGVSIDLLSETESALSSVKERFGIKVSVSKLEADTSSYKSVYKVGEHFDMTGLKIVVTYDDYSEVIYYADKGQVILDSSYDEALSELYNSVRVSIPDLGRTVLIGITVTDEDVTPENPPEDNGESGCGAGCGSSGGLLIGAAALLIVGAMIFIRCYRKAKKADSRGNQSDNSGD